MIVCSKCGAQFTDAQVESADCCPACKTRNRPLDTADDVGIVINTGDLRILGFWAENYAVTVDNGHLDDAQHDSLKERLARIFVKIHPQLQAVGKDVPLSMSEEVADLRKCGHDATLFRDGKEEV